MPLDLAALAGGFAEGAGERLIEFGIGAAIAEALRPEAVELGQEAWRLNPVRAVDPETAALIVAEDVERRDWGAAEAEASGIDGERFDAMIGEVLAAPGVAELFEASRRKLIDDDDFRHGLRKAKLEPRWDAPLMALRDRLLSVDTLAAARQQGFVTPERQHAESALQGIDDERAEILYEVVGLPPGAETAMQAYNRGLADDALFAQIIREGHTKTKYTDLMKALRRRLVTPHEYAELRLRGWIDDAAMHSGAALSGMEPADTDLLHSLLGRPIPVHQVTTGEARGGRFNGPAGEIPEAYVRSLEEGNLRPEWYHLAYANRYTYPSAFVLRALAQAGELSEQETHDILLRIGWPPDLAGKVAPLWTGGATAKGDPHVAKAQTQLWTALHKAYVNDEADDAQATPTLATIGVAVDAIPRVLTLWQAEREVVRLTLTPTQIKKAYAAAKFTRDQAVTRLEQLGMTPADANTLLDE